MKGKRELRNEVFEPTDLVVGQYAIVNIQSSILNGENW
jgi:hypothetical protein